MKHFRNIKLRPYTAFVSEDAESFSHRHDQVELAYILSGTATYTIQDTQQELRPGQLILLFPYLPHAVSHVSADSRILTILFDLDFIPDFQRRFCEYEMTKCVFSKKETEPFTHEALNWLLSYTTKETSEDSATVLLKQKGWLTAILGDLFYKRPILKRTVCLEPETVRNIIHYVEQHIDKSFTQEQLTADLGISRHYLSHNLKPSIYMSYNQLLNFVRVKYADHLLSTTSMSFLDIALSCGYPTLSAFTRNYKNLTGMTPTEFRKNIQSDLYPEILPPAAFPVIQKPTDT